MTSTTLQSNPVPTAVVTKRSGLGLFCQALVGLTPSAEYRDKALLSSLDQQLALPDVQASLARQLVAIPKDEWAGSQFQTDPSVAMALPTRDEYLRRMAAYVVNPRNEGWLDAAIQDATGAPGMRALSLAISLGSEHSRLSFDSLLALAAVLLMPVLGSSMELDESLPDFRQLDVKAPRLHDWSTVRNADYLFRQSGIEMLCSPSEKGTVLRFTARETWRALIQTAQFKSVFAPLLSYMDWYGGRPGEQASPRMTQAIVGRIIVDHYVGAVQFNGEPLETSLRRGWVSEQSHLQLRDKVRSLISDHYPQASPSTIDMLHYLFLRETMPELLVEGVPDHLQYGRSLQSIAFIHGVALVEAMTPGLSQITHYDDLTKVSSALAQSSDADIHALWARTLVAPALRYARAHGAIQSTVDDDHHAASSEQISQALAYLKAQQDQHAQELHSLLAIKPPDRKDLAQKMLKTANVPHELWDQGVKTEHWPILQDHGFTVASSYSLDRLAAVGQPEASVVELVMMGELYIEGQPTVAQAYATAFDAYQQALVSAEARIIKRQLSEMQTGDQETLLTSTCELSRVRFGSQEGTQGLFIRCQPGNHLKDFHGHSVRERFFELIPAAGIAGEARQKFTYEVDGVTWSRPISLIEAFNRKAAHEQRIEKARVTPLLPMDSDAYLTGTVSRSSQVYHQPQEGTLIPSAELVYLDGESMQTGLEALANKAAGYLLASFLEQNKAAHTHDTEWEEIWAKERKYADIAARLIIPFYGCIKDLSDGDYSGGVIANCVIDAAFALIPLGQFAGSTARIVLRAGELSVESVARLTSGAVTTLIKGLAEQSAVFAVRDLGKLGLKMSALGWIKLFEELPSLSEIFATRSVLDSSVGLDKGVYRIVEGAEHPQSIKGLAARVDGRPGVVTRDVGTLEQPDFRLLDPHSDRVFGKRLTALALGQGAEFSAFAAGEYIGVNGYPPVAPLTSLEDGIHELRIADSCRVQAIEREEGVFDILIDDEIYHLDANSPDAALRKLKAEKLSPRSALLQETENICRVQRDLISVPCALGVKLVTPSPEPFIEQAGVPNHVGRYPSQAMAAREFGLARLTSAGASIEVFVDDGKFCKWVESLEGSSSGAGGGGVTPLSDTELLRFALPEVPNYLPEFRGVLAADAELGLPGNFPLNDARKIYEHAPVVYLEGIAAGVEDARGLRGIRMNVEDIDWIFVEADTGIFYKAPIPADGSRGLIFSRVTNAAEINEYVRLSEQYRVFSERPGAVADQQNIARLLFDLLSEEERAAWGVRWNAELTTYDEYVNWCRTQERKNELSDYAANILAGESRQRAFVELAKSSIPDFLRVTDRTAEEKAGIVEILNNLLPVQESSLPAPSKAWSALTVEKIGTSNAARSIGRQINGANLSYIEVVTEEEQRIVYYALSAGERARDVKLRIDVVGEAEQMINGVIYRDARALMSDVPPDPGFTSLPVIRDANTVRVREFGRYHDSERLIATVIKRDMQGRSLRSMNVFTLMDTCRSCGGVVLPRLKLDFPGASFSVTFLRNYGAS
ncbi:deaminase domain-containing protein [Pseudomonas syringae]|uniref:deaminase domain-containing protein n=1 Tax=Pseudomonas syringae TaxID=317 RepID=UPI003F7761A0